MKGKPKIINSIGNKTNVDTKSKSVTATNMIMNDNVNVTKANNEKTNDSQVTESKLNNDESDKNKRRMRMIKQYKRNQQVFCWKMVIKILI